VHVALVDLIRDRVNMLWVLHFISIIFLNANKNLPFLGSLLFVSLIFYRLVSFKIIIKNYNDLL
jgi:hypothetical protein